MILHGPAGEIPNTSAVVKHNPPVFLAAQALNARLGGASTDPQPTET